MAYKFSQMHKNTGYIIKKNVSIYLNLGTRNLLFYYLLIDHYDVMK
jgi:hypothetical protein